jgi:hypothetical protein
MDCNNGIRVNNGQLIGSNPISKIKTVMGPGPSSNGLALLFSHTFYAAGLPEGNCQTVVRAG